ncbi:hypothetical protein PC114_g1261 [Phytophthora cactorum]|nr:hypothetical protein PC114_g1261 [Phytophthora cactorum]KAG3097383.1 hypothetical protein PC122_g4539 [Phytophthora cactorum]KAG3103029.1 hypothetical protein PC121_g1072 [Phytophthora cactorum]
MTSFQQEDDTSVFEAALSFVDEFDFDASTSASCPQLHEEVMSTPSQTVASTAPVELPSKAEKRRLRAEKKRMLRKAGIYSDPNRARNEQTREIAFLREQMEKLQLDLQKKVADSLGLLVKKRTRQLNNENRRRTLATRIQL